MNQLWDPNQYKKFSKERDAPFYDLLQLITPYPSMNIVDLGCGTGALTQALHQHLHAKRTLGIDSSAEMLARSHHYKENDLDFQQLDIHSFVPTHPLDLIFSNACLQWIPDHPTLFKKLTSYLLTHGQLAVQVPANFNFPTHVIAKELAKEYRFAQDLPEQRPINVLSIEEYSVLLYQLGFQKQRVRAEIYAVTLESTESAIEWVKGSLLTFYRSHLSEERYQEFLANYRQRIYDHFGDISPFFFPFKRILIWGEK